MKFPVEMSPVDIDLGSIENLSTFDHGCIQIHPRERNGTPIYSYGIEKYSDHQLIKAQQEQRLQQIETPARQVYLKTGGANKGMHPRDVIRDANMREIMQDQRKYLELQKARNAAKKSQQQGGQRLSHPNANTTVADYPPGNTLNQARQNLVDERMLNIPGQTSNGLQNPDNANRFNQRPGRAPNSQYLESSPAKGRMVKSSLIESPVAKLGSNDGNLKLLQPMSVEQLLEQTNLSKDPTQQQSKETAALNAQRKKLLKAKMKLVTQLIIKERQKLQNQARTNPPLSPRSNTRLDELTEICSRMKRNSLNFLEISRLNTIEKMEISYMKSFLKDEKVKQKQAFDQKVNQIEQLQKQIEEDRIKAIMEEKMRQAELQMQEDSQMQSHLKLSLKVKKKEAQVDKIKKKLEKKETDKTKDSKKAKNEGGGGKDGQKKAVKDSTKAKEGKKAKKQSEMESKAKKGKKADKKVVIKSPEKKKGWFGGMFKKKESSAAKKKKSSDLEYLDAGNNGKYKAKETKRIKLPFSKTFF